MLYRYVLPALIIVIMGCTKQDNHYPVFDNPCDELDYFDKEMNDLYYQVMEKHQDQTRFTRNFKQAQVMWTQYRNAMTQVYMDQKTRPRDYTRSQKDCRCKKMAELTRKRFEELQPFIADMDDIPACWNK